LIKAASGVLAARRGSTRGTCGGEELIRSHLIEASGSSEAWYVPPRLFACCGLAGQPDGNSDSPGDLLDDGGFDIAM
jgi:hypothetical protein